MAYESDLFKWERITKPRVYSRTHRVTSNDDIQDWIQKVEHASSKAAAETFGTKYIPPRKTGNVACKKVAQDAQIHEAAYSEAQDLLNQWVSDKIHLDNDFDEYSEEKWNKKTQADIRKEWDHLLSDDVDLELEETRRNILDSESIGGRRSKINDRDPYAILYKDENDLVSEVLDEIWEKDLLDENVKKHLEFDTEKQYDPTTKMKLRHQQVRENREKRLKDKEKRLKDLQMKKDSHFKARQMLLKEEKAKALEKKREEDEIQKQMTKIKKEMESEKKKQREEASRQKAEEEALAEKASAELERQKNEEMKALRKTQYQAEEKRRLLMSKMKEIETKRTTENLKLLQKSFSAWYNVIIERRLAMGKAKATADWRLLLRTFNGWKAYTRAKHMDRQAWTHEENLKDFHRKNNMADIFYKHRLLSKCITAWELFVSQQQTERYFEENSKKTKDKMASFLEAAATGKLWTERSEVESSRSSDPKKKAKEIESLFNEPERLPGTFSMSSTARTDVSSKTTKKKVETPTEPWQVTRKHLKLTKGQITKMATNSTATNIKEKLCTCDKNPNSGDDKTLCSFCSNQQQQQQTTAKTTKKAWEKNPPFQVNNFEHRHAAQQKILEMQQKQIKEQQRLIEELQYLQKQQLLQQQLLQQEHAKKQLDRTYGGGDTAESIQNTLTHLQQHIHKLQQQIIDGGRGGVNEAAGSSSGGATPHNIEDKNGAEQHDITITDLEDETGAPSDATMKLDLSQINLPNCYTGENAKTERTAKSTVSNTSTLSKADSSATSRTTNSRHTQFLKTMEQRAQERAAVKKEREMKRLQQEQLKVAQIMAEEEQRKLEEAESKQKRIEEHREKKRLEKQRELQKKEFTERMKELTVMADNHRQKALLKYRGWRPWRRLIQNLRDKEQLAINHYHNRLLRICMGNWHNTVKNELEEKYKVAENFNTYRIIHHTFSQWKQVKHASIIQEQKAINHYKHKLKVRVVKEWADFAAEEKVSMWHKERRAGEHNIVRIKKKYFNLLRYLPVYRKEQEERERRRNEMRKKVAHLLPDFRASQNDENL